MTDFVGIYWGSGDSTLSFFKTDELCDNDKYMAVRNKGAEESGQCFHMSDFCNGTWTDSGPCSGFWVRTI